jgi:hypothetical protein
MLSTTTNTRESLRPAAGRLRGWAVIGTDGEKVGSVRAQLEDAGGAGYLEVELDGTAMAQSLQAGGPGREMEVTAGAYPGDANRPGSRPLADVDPTVGESSRTASLNAGSRQHAAAATGAVPRDDDRQGGNARPEHPRVLIPLAAARLKETDQQVVLTTLRAADVKELPPFTAG